MVFSVLSKSFSPYFRPFALIRKDTTGCVFRPLFATIYGYFQDWQQKKNIFSIDRKKAGFPPIFQKGIRENINVILTNSFFLKIVKFGRGVNLYLKKNDNPLIFPVFFFITRSEIKKIVFRTIFFANLQRIRSRQADQMFLPRI